MKRTAPPRLLSACTVFLLACCIAAVASAQTRTLRIVTYNIEADISGYTTPRPGLVTPSGGGTYQQGGVLEGIGEEIVGSDPAQPIDILALQETTSNTTTVGPITNALNTYYNTPGMYAYSTYQATQSGSASSGNGPNALVYNTTTVQLIASMPVDPPGGTSKLGGVPNGSGELREVMRYEFAPAGETPTPANEFYIYVSHYKSGTTSTDLNDRTGEAQIIRNDEVTNCPPNARVIYVGDYNVSTSTETSYQIMLAASAPDGVVQGQGIDPMNLSGATGIDWTINSLLNQKSESSTSLHYRDDFQVMTTNVYNGTPGGLAYVPGSYHVFGVNGTTSYETSVNSGSNTALTNLQAGATISAAQLLLDLTTASDHLPVVADYTIPLSAPSMAVSPASSFTSSGNQGGTFSPSSQVYGVTNTGTASLNWTASKTANWLTLSATSGTLAAGVGTSVTVSISANANSLASSTYTDTVSFTNTSNGAGNTTRAVSLTVNAVPAQLAAGPTSGFGPGGYVGGPFSPSNQTYSLTNTGGTTLNWTASITANWLTLSATGGTLAAGATTNVTVSLNGNANGLTAGSYSDTVSFSNTSNGAGNTTRAVSLTVNAMPAQLAAGPASGFSSSDYVGGPFSPSGQTYSLTNTGGTTLNWTASITANWLALSATGGTLAAGATTNVTVSLNGNANGLTAGNYSDTVSFSNTSNGAGNTTRPVSLTVNPIPLVALFTGSPTNGPEPLLVTFSDTSTGSITNRAWNFGDGMTTNTTATGVTHTYAAGSYTVTLIASGTGGSSTNAQTNYVTALTAFQSWQVLYFGSTSNTNAAPDADPDHDGQTNWAEYLAGTDPTDSNSVLRVTSIAQEGNDIRVTWTMGSGKTNVLQRADSIDGPGSFSDLFTVLTVGSVTNYLDAGALTNASTYFYRVRLGP